MKISIIGTGYVGLVTGAVLAECKKLKDLKVSEVELPDIFPVFAG